MTQKRALELMRSGANIFLCGPPGSGKSFVLEQFMKLAVLDKRKVALTATTGIAASLIGGVTIHSWSGLFNSGRLSTNFDLISPVIKDRLISAEILIIDEVSMLDIQTLDALNDLLKEVRSVEVPFGGLQLILSGDFFQLPPVSKVSPAYCFLSQSWQEADLTICYLSEQHRQSNDELTEILVALRERRFNKYYLSLLSARQGVSHRPVTHLLTHNREVDELNDYRLNQLEGKIRNYSSRSYGNSKLATELSRSVLAPKELQLRVGAEVMFVVNDIYKRFVNGTQGTVIGFKFNLPVIELKTTKNQIIAEPHQWKIESELGGAELIQLPLKLAWAITIHKCQGMSLEVAEIDLRRSFAYGMGYVAISRLRSYRGLYLSSYNSRSLQLDNFIYDFDDLLKQKSRLNEAPRILNMTEKTALALFKSGMSPWLIKQTTGLNQERLKNITDENRLSE